MFNLHIGNIDLSDNKNFQSLYTSQLYGTLFGIYGKFTTKPTDHGYFIEKIVFKTINYKGILDLNITLIRRPELINYQFPEDPLTGATPEPVKVLAFLIEVQALKNNTNLESISFIYENGGGSNGLEIGKGNFIHIDRRLKPIHEDEVPLKNDIFDTEFYYREGILQTGEKYKPIEPKPKTSKDGDVTVLIAHEGGICPRGTVKII